MSSRCEWIRATRPESHRSETPWMSTTRAEDQSLRMSPGSPPFCAIHLGSPHRYLQGRPAWLPGWSQPTACFAEFHAISLTCIPANEVAVGFRCTRRTSLLELTTTRLAEDLRADRSLPLEVLVIIVRDNETERSKGLVMRNLRIIKHQQIRTDRPVTWNNVTRLLYIVHYTLHPEGLKITGP